MSQERECRWLKRCHKEGGRKNRVRVIKANIVARKEGEPWN